MLSGFNLEERRQFADYLSRAYRIFERRRNGTGELRLLGYLLYRRIC